MGGLLRCSLLSMLLLFCELALAQSGWRVRTLQGSIHLPLVMRNTGELLKLKQIRILIPPCVAPR